MPSASYHEFYELPENFMEDCSSDQSQEQLLSPFNTDHSKNEPNCESMIAAQPHGLKATAMEIRRPLQYIEELENITPIHQAVNTHIAAHCIQQTADAVRQERGQETLCTGLANAEAPLAIGNVLSDSSIAPVISEQSNLLNSQHAFQPAGESIQNRNCDEAYVRNVAKKNPFAVNIRDMKEFSEYATSNHANPVSDDNIYINTLEICRRVQTEMHTHSIPQSLFAQKILNRSQGTLSELLRKPRPWENLKSGREVYLKMYTWMQQPLQERLTSLDMPKSENREGSCRKRPKLNSESRKQETMENVLGTRNGKNAFESKAKKSRFVFTAIQKRTLHAAFRRKQRPTREQEYSIAQHLNLDLSSVTNFFMNARRRYRNELYMAATSIDARRSECDVSITPIVKDHLETLRNVQSNSNATLMQSMAVLPEYNLAFQFVRKSNYNSATTMH